MNLHQYLKDIIKNTILNLSPKFYYFLYKKFSHKQYSALLDYARDIYNYKISNNIEILTCFKELDNISLEIIKTIFDRIAYISCSEKLKKNRLFSYEEILEQRRVLSFIKNTKKQLRIPLDRLDPSVFYYYCGLSLIQENINNLLYDRDYIDGGAYLGDSSLVFEKNFSPRRIYSFEPNPINYNLLLETINKNKLQRIIPLNYGLGKDLRCLQMRFMGASSRISAEGDYVNVTTIDDFVSHHNLDVGYIKLDVEGMGYEAIIGSINTIKKFRPVLSIAIYHNGREFFEIYRYLKARVLNYSFIMRKLDPASPFFETFLIGLPKN
jgi:FkbM family methyltransferase